MNDNIPPPAPAPFNPPLNPNLQFHPNQGAPRLERAVERANTELANALTGLDKAFEVLLNRLDPVLMPVAPPGPSSPQAPSPAKPPQCELAGSIERKTAVVVKLMARVEAVTDRLEL